MIFKGCRLARMISGHYYIIRDLGPVKGGKGMKHHEEVLGLSPKGIFNFCICIAKGLPAKRLQRATLR